MNARPESEPHDSTMHRRHATMPDGRALYYFTFEEEPVTGEAAPSLRDGVTNDEEERDV